VAFFRGPSGWTVVTDQKEFEQDKKDHDSGEKHKHKYYYRSRCFSEEGRPSGDSYVIKDHLS